MQNVYLMEQVAAQRRTERQREAGQQRLIVVARPATGQRFTWRGLAGAPAALACWLGGHVAASSSLKSIDID